MKKITYTLEVILKTPLSVFSGESKRGFNRSIIKSLDGEPFIPASEIKGIVKNNYISIFDCKHNGNDCTCEACQIFGRAGNSDSLIFFEDLKPAGDDYKVSYRIGTAIDRKRREVLHNALYSQEMVEGTKFSGKVELYLNKKLKEMGAKEKVECAIKMIDKLGACKSRGLGYVEVRLKEGNLK